MSLGSESPEGLLRPFALLGALVFVALLLLYVFDLFYLQFLLVVWGAAVMGGTVVYERRKGAFAESPMALGDAERLISLQKTLAAIDERLSESPGEEETLYLRSRKEEMGEELRKLRWSMREAGLESIRRASGQEGLRPLPPRRGPLRRRGQERLERSHLLDSLEEAEEVLATEPAESARARVEMIAADVRAHYYLLKELEPRSRNLGDYGTAWAALTTISKGMKLDHDVRLHASKRVRAKLDGLFDVASGRGLEGSAAKPEELKEDAERLR